MVALLLSVYNTIMQRRDRHPRLKVTTDKRMLPGSPDEAFSCRVVNEGTVPVTIRSIRIFLNTGSRFTDRFGKGSSIPFPTTGDFLDPYLLENEVRFPDEDEAPGAKELPKDLQSSQSVRFATNEDGLHKMLLSAGMPDANGVIGFRIGVVDHRDKWHMSRGLAEEIKPPAPEQPLP